MCLLINWHAKTFESPPPVVGHLLDIAVVNPGIAEIVVTSDGLVLAKAEGEAGTNHLIGSYADLLRNWLALISVAGLTTAERAEAESLFATKIGYFIGGGHEN
jgi:hypothetical protein